MSTPTIVPTRGLTDRATATTVGILYIVGTVAGVSSVVVTGGGIEGPDYLADAEALGDSLPLGAALVLVMGLSLAFIPIVVYPVLRRTSERFAVGYVVFRGAIETTLYIFTAMSWLLLFQLAPDYASGAGASPITGDLLGLMGTTSGTLQTFVFVIGAVMFYLVLWWARLVPRWLSGWGLLALIPYFIVAVLGMFDMLDAMSGTGTAMQMPLALQEMVLALWLIIRGFSGLKAPVEGG